MGIIRAGGPATLLDSNTFSGSVDTWTSGALPQTYNRLIIEILAKSDSGAGFDDVVLRFNSDATAANYVTQVLAQVSTTVTGATKTAETGISLTLTGDTGPNTETTSQIILEVLNPFATTFYKLVTGQGVRANGTAGTNYTQNGYAGEWKSTAAISTVTLEDPGNNNFTSGSIIRVYGAD